MPLGLTVPDQTLYNPRRIQIRQYKSDQAAQLEEQIQNYQDFDRYLLCDDDSFAGCYFFHSLFAGVDMDNPNGASAALWI
jgi:hypothetical protein